MRKTSNNKQTIPFLGACHQVTSMSYFHMQMAKYLPLIRHSSETLAYNAIITVNHTSLNNPKTSSHIALQLVGLFSVFDIELMRITGVVMKMLAIVLVAELSLALLSMQELRLVAMDLKLRACLLGLLLVLVVALELPYSQWVSDLGVILNAKEAHLLAFPFDKCLLVAELRRNGTTYIKLQF